MKLTLDPFDPNSVKKVLKRVERYRRNFPDKVNRFCKELAQIGLDVAKPRLESVPYDGNDEFSITIEKIATGYRIIARGESVAFIEFGAGVYYNGEEGYYLDRPPEISNIGEYGKGHGKKEKWYYYPEGDRSEPAVSTRGNPPANAFFYAETEVVMMVSQIARRVFIE